MIDEGDCGAIGGMKIGRGNRSTRRKSAPAPLCPPQIPHDQTRAQTRAAAVGSQRLTAWAMAWPKFILSLDYVIFNFSFSLKIIFYSPRKLTQDVGFWFARCSIRIIRISGLCWLIFCDLSQYLQANNGVVHQIKTSTFLYAISNSLLTTIQSFDSACSELRTTSSHEMQLSYSVPVTFAHSTKKSRL
jgi:hypothetical protein